MKVFSRMGKTSTLAWTLMWASLLALVLASVLMLSACSTSGAGTASGSGADASAGSTLGADGASSPAQNDIVILFTNDVHCGISDGMGYAGLAAYKQRMEAITPYVTLVDAGDAVQGDVIGTVSEGEYLVDIMNEVGYDLAVFGNHEFDYGMEQLEKLLDMAEYRYLCANVTYQGTGLGTHTGSGASLEAGTGVGTDTEADADTDSGADPETASTFLDSVEPWAILEYGNVKVGFVGVTTPHTLTSSTPTNFMEEGEYVYDFAAGGEAGNEGVRMVRNRETALGNLVADAYRFVGGSDIAMVNGGGIRADLTAGDITYGDAIAVHPFGNMLCTVETTGQDILDCLEVACRFTRAEAAEGGQAVGEDGIFQHVSGLRYTIDTSVPSPMLADETMLDYQVLITYITDGLQGQLGERYATIEGRITVK